MASPEHQQLKGPLQFSVDNLSYPDYAQLLYVAHRLGGVVVTPPDLLDSISLESLMFAEAPGHVGIEHFQHFSDRTGFGSISTANALFGRQIDPNGWAKQKERVLSMRRDPDRSSNYNFQRVLDTLIEQFPIPTTVIRRADLGLPPYLASHRRQRMAAAGLAPSTAFYKEFALSIDAFVEGTVPRSDKGSDQFLFGFAQQLGRQQSRDEHNTNI
jgi:hypothetical protein